MVFKKKKFFFSSKKSPSSSDSSNSPLSAASNSPIVSQKNKPEPNSTRESQSLNPSPGSSLAGVRSNMTQVNDGSSKGKEPSSQVHSLTPGKSNLSPSVSEGKKPFAETPIMASSLGLNRIKTRSGPLPQERFFDFGNDKATIPCCDLPKLGTRGDSASPKKEVEAKLDHVGPLRCNIHALPASRTCVTCGGHFNVSHSGNGDVGSSEFCTPENSYELESPKESESPRYQALLRMTSAPRKRFPGDIKSFSHELNSKGVRPFPLWKPHWSNNLEEVMNLIRKKFEKAKEDVNSDLGVFASDLVDLLESHPELQVTIEDLLILAQKSAEATSGEFWLQCEGIVQDLDDRRQELPPGLLKQLHTRMLFILTRCTRLLQFHKESWGKEEEVTQLRQSRVLYSADKRVPTGEVKDGRGSSAAKALMVPSPKKSYSQEQRGLNWKEGFILSPDPLSSPYNETSTDSESPPENIDRMSSWKRLPSPASKGVKESAVSNKQNDSKVEPPKVDKNLVAMSDDLAVAKPPDCPPAKLSHEHMSKHRHNISWGYWGDQSCISEESSIICRICEEEIPTTHVEDHSRICALAAKYGQKSVNVDERLMAVAVTLEKITENFTPKDSLAAVESPDAMKISNASGESDVLSPELSGWWQRGSEGMLDCFPEADNSAFMDDMRCLNSMLSRTRFGPKSDQGMTTSSAGSMTPRSPIPTPRPDPIELLLGSKCTIHDQDDIPQMAELADIARCVADATPDDDLSIQLLLSCLEDLRVVIDRRKFDALIVEIFGTRIEKLIQEKYLQMCELLDDEKVDLSSTVIDEDVPLEDDVVRSLTNSPVHPRDRTSIKDFRIIKGISRGAFGRVFLAEKKTTGDLFAIKVLKKADMIRKNAVESILAERDILINSRNPFVVRFFYSFTCPENLYLVMEYLNGGDFYSLLGTLGRLDETTARVYIAEVVLALEYLHSEGVVHRDLKPDNLLIAHDGHVKLTDFGLSNVGLINSTNLSGPVSSGTSLLVEEKPKFPTSEHQLVRRDKRSAVGTPDYLAPEILLGTGHGATADWWSVGIILFEFIVGIPPFNASHPQQIFDNILNRNIPWPSVPEFMSYEARDLIDRLLTEDPDQRLGAGGASEVKQHIFFKDINWYTLAEQKAAFVPESENALDTGYFQSRYPCNSSDELCIPANEKKDSSDSGSSGCLSDDHKEGVDEHSETAEFQTRVSANYPFDNFSFKNLSQLAYINYDLTSKSQKDGTYPSLHRREEAN